MRSTPLLCAIVSLCSAGCGASGPNSGLQGTYSSIDDAPINIVFKSGGKVEMIAEGLGSSSGTYTVDGEKILVNIDGQNHTFIRDGNCVEEPRQIIGKMCKGGKAGAASNVSTRNVPTAPSGTYVATNDDGEFTITFKPGNTVTLAMTPKIGNPETVQGSFTMEGDRMYARVGQGTSMVLRFVNDAWESAAFGLPMRFVRR